MSVFRPFCRVPTWIFARPAIWTRDRLRGVVVARTAGGLEQVVVIHFGAFARLEGDIDMDCDVDIADAHVRGLQIIRERCPISSKARN